jgi:bile acid:Na+ symporter, BASS family
VKQANPHKIGFGLAVACLLAACGIVLSGHTAAAGPFFVAFFIALAVAVRGWQPAKGISYTLCIFAAVTAAMFHPDHFISIGGFKLKTLIVPLLQVIMFGMGSQMSFEDFTGVIRMPKGVIIGVSAHYLIMPLVGFGIANTFDFPPEIKAGIILIGCVPSGLASNVMSYIARANLALAVTIGAISTLLSPVLTPLLMKRLGGQYIDVKFWDMMLDILDMIILPILAGFVFNLFSNQREGRRSGANQVLVGSPRRGDQGRLGEPSPPPMEIALSKPELRPRRSITLQLTLYLTVILLTNLVFVEAKNAGAAQFLKNFAKSMCWSFFLPMLGGVALGHFLKTNRALLGKILSLISMTGIAVIITIITASGRDSLLKVGALLMLTSLLHNLAGYLLGYSVSWFFGMAERDRRTVAFEVGMQNGGLASGLALNMGKIATVGLAPAIFGPLMNITG